MKNASVFVDVDLPLVDANQKLLPGATEALVKLRDRGCHLFLWSTNGADYVRKIASLYNLTEMFEGFAAKPDIIIDPLVFDINDESSWPALAEKIIRKHID
jgi:hypothetical protein